MMNDCTVFSCTNTHTHTVNLFIYFLINLLRCGGNTGDTCPCLIFQIRFSDSLRFISSNKVYLYEACYKIVRYNMRLSKIHKIYHNKKRKNRTHKQNSSKTKTKLTVCYLHFPVFFFLSLTSLFSHLHKCISVHFVCIVRPLDVMISSPNQPLSSDRPYEILCEAVGSRPPAKITWWLGQQELFTHQQKVIYFYIY